MVGADGYFPGIDIGQGEIYPNDFAGRFSEPYPDSQAKRGMHILHGYSFGSFPDTAKIRKENKAVAGGQQFPVGNQALVVVYCGLIASVSWL